MGHALPLMRLCSRCTNGPPGRACHRSIKTFAAAEPRQARYLRHHALMLAEALLGAVEGSLSAAEVEAGTLARAQQAQEAQPAAVGAAAEAPTPMEVEPTAGAEQQQQQASRQQQRSPAPAPPLLELAVSAPGFVVRPDAAAQTPAPGGGACGGMPGTDLRAVLGTPAALPCAEQQQLQERSTALLGMAHSFQRDVARWLQVRLRPPACLRVPGLPVSWQPGCCVPVCMRVCCHAACLLPLACSCQLMVPHRRRRALPPRRLQLVSSAAGSGSAARDEVQVLAAAGVDVLLR